MVSSSYHQSVIVPGEIYFTCKLFGIMCSFVSNFTLSTRNHIPFLLYVCEHFQRVNFVQTYASCEHFTSKSVSRGYSFQFEQQKPVWRVVNFQFAHLHSGKFHSNTNDGKCASQRVCQI